MDGRSPSYQHDNIWREILQELERKGYSLEEQVSLLRTKYKKELAFYPELQSLETIQKVIETTGKAPAKIDFLSLFNKNLYYVPQLHLPKLKNLFLDNNKLTTLPDFRYLPKLEQLLVSNNKLKEVPDFKLPKLKILSLWQNELKKVPDFKLRKLTDLILSWNKLTEIPDFEHLPKLEELELAWNDLRKVPNFRYMPELRNLILYNNKIRRFPDFKYLKDKSGIRLGGQGA